jgi:putative multicomponent Na+:H+ antiporter subunit B
MTDLDLLAIVALLPIAAVMTLLQKDPYHALVVRGILGAIAALVYALFGAADVALTEALVGTMLAITLYMVAVRSSLVLRLGVLAELEDLPEISDLFNEPESSEPRVTPHIFINSGNDSIGDSTLDEFSPIREAVVSSMPEPLIADLRDFCRQHFLRLELVPYPDRAALHAALETRDVHAISTGSASASLPETAESTPRPDPLPYALSIRVPRLYDLMQVELNPAIVTLRSTFPIEPTDPTPISPASKP